MSANIRSFSRTRRRHASLAIMSLSFSGSVMGFAKVFDSTFSRNSSIFPISYCVGYRLISII